MACKCIYIYTCVYVYVLMHACMHACMPACMCDHVCVSLKSAHEDTNKLCFVSSDATSNGAGLSRGRLIVRCLCTCLLLDPPRHQLRFGHSQVGHGQLWSRPRLRSISIACKSSHWTMFLPQHIQHILFFDQWLESMENKKEKRKQHHRRHLCPWKWSFFTILKMSKGTLAERQSQPVPCRTPTHSTNACLFFISSSRESISCKPRNGQHESLYSHWTIWTFVMQW